MNAPEQIDIFLDSKAYGVVGASTNRDKYGNKVLRCFLQNGYQAIPVNPKDTRNRRHPLRCNRSRPTG